MGTLLQVKKRIPLPVVCMVRPREGGFCYTECEFEVMPDDARVLLEHGADGIVFGCLQEDGTVDAGRCKRMLEVIGAKGSVFHLRARRGARRLCRTRYPHRPRGRAGADERQSPTVPEARRSSNG